MKNRFKSFILLFAVLGFSTTQAATINYQKRTINNGVNNTDYKASWNSQTSAISSQSINDFTDKLGGNNTFSHLIVDFTSSKSTLSFDFAVDAGFGGAVYLDNKLVTKNTTDLWWGKNWNASSEILSFTSLLRAGNHTLEVFWAEGCCNGANSGRFSLNGVGNWQSLATANLDPLKPVPVPAAAWLFGSGIASLFGLRRKAITRKPALA